MSTKKRTPAMLLLVAAIWLGGIGVGSLIMWQHEFTAGENLDAPGKIPETLRSLTFQDKPLTIVMAVHPECPCTGASLEQLDRLMTRNSESIQLIGLVLSNDDSAPSDSLESTAYWQRLSAIPNARPIADPDGSLAKLLGAKVSGAIAAYDQFGNLRFQGGITASRGHAGPSRGMDSLEAIARQLAPLELCSMPAFGCGLENDQNSL